MRKNWLDNLRWVTVVLVLVYHVFYYFNNKGVFGGIGGFDPDPMKQPQDAILYILYPWFMMLLFLLAGASARYSLGRRTGKEFIKSRTLKLLVPSTIGLFVFQWIVGYFNTKGAGEALAAIPGPAKYFMWALSGIGPLWFAQELWLFSLLVVLVKKMDGKDRLWNWCGKATVPVIIMLGLVVYLASQVMIRNPRAESLDGLFNLYRPVTYLAVFLLGYFVFSHDAVQQKVQQMTVPMVVCAAVSGIALLVTGWGKTNTDPAFLCSWLNCLYAWLMILAMMGAFMSWYDKADRFTAYMTRTSYGLYVLHYSILAAVGYTLKMSTSLPPAAIYAIVFVAVMVGTPLLYEIIRRIPVIRWCVLGEKRAK